MFTVLFGLAALVVESKSHRSGLPAAGLISIQSISKVFTMAKVIEEQGPDAIADNMGVDATSQVFNSIVAVEQDKGAEMNAMVNAGAITATSMVSGTSRSADWNKILDYYSDFSQSQAEYARAFAALAIEWRWELVTTKSLRFSATAAKSSL